MLKKSLSIVLALVLMLTGVQVALADTEISAISTFTDSNIKYYAVSQYEGYMYSISENGLTVIDITDMQNPQDITDRDNADITSTKNVSMEPNNTYTYVHGDYLYALVTDQKQLRRFSLQNPASPQLSRTYQLSGTGTLYYMAFSDNYAYIASEGNFVTVNLQTGAARSVNGTSYRVLKVHNGYLFAGGYNGLDIYDLSSSGSNPSRIYSNSLQFGSSSQRAIMDFGFVDDYCIFTTYSASDWMKRNVWYMDISDMSNLEAQEFGKFVAGDTLTRLNTIVIRNGLMFVTDIDALIHVFDVSNMPNLTKLDAFTVSFNPYNMVMDDQYMYMSTFMGELRIYDYVTSNLTLESEYTSAQNPIVISGTALGSSAVTVAIGGVEKVVSVGDNGQFKAEFDDEFIPNGTHTVTATLYQGDNALISKTAPVTVNHPPRVAVDDTAGISYTDGTVSHSITLVNNVDAQKLHLITAAYKGDTMIGYEVDTKSVDAGGPAEFDNEFTKEGAQTICSYLVRELDGKYTLVWESAVYGQALSNGTITLPADSDSAVNVIQETRQATFGFRSENIGATGIVLVFKPNNEDLTAGLEYVGTATVGTDGVAVLDFTLQTPAVEDQDYTILASIPEKGAYKIVPETFRHYGEGTLGPILQWIKQSTELTIENILEQNANKLSIDMAEGSAYASLQPPYQSAVLAKFAGSDYTVKGSLQFKIDFNAAVNAEIERQIYDLACADALAAFNAADTADAMEDVFDQHPVLDIDKEQTGYWANLKPTAKDKVVQRFDVAGPYTKVEDVFEDYMDFTALEYINQTPYDQLGQVLDKAGETLGLTFSKTFTQFSAKNKQYVYKELARGVDYADVKALQDELDEAIKYVYNEYVKDNDRGGRSPVNSGPAYPVSTQPTPTPTPTQAPDQSVTEEPLFHDLDGVDWAREAILSLAEAGIVHGRGDGIFAPNANVTKEEFVKMAVSAFEIPMDVEGELPFTDVQTTDWSYPYIRAAYDAGIVSGVSQDRFAPKTNISRQDMCVILYNILKSENYLEISKDIAQFADFDEISEYSKEAIGALYSAGLANGVGEDRFAPKASSTRAMAARLIYGCIEYSKGE